MFHHRRIVAHLDDGEGVGTTSIAQQQTVTLGEVATTSSLGGYLDHTAIAVLAVSGTNALAHYGARAVLAQVNHLCAGVSFLPVIGQRHAVKLTY